VIFAEYAIDTAHACHALGIRTIAVTAGYITEAAREAFFSVMDAANIDLKAFTDDFYRGLCAAELGPVLETIKYVSQSDTWLELTTLLIPGRNDSPEEIDRLSAWVAEAVSPHVPLHFTAYHPDYRLLDTPATPASTCRRARRQAQQRGLKYVYTGNIADPDGQTTYCPKCTTPVIRRDGYSITGWQLDGHRCRACSAEIAGRFADAGPSHFGPRRLPVSVPSSPAHR
jgi:pyruvate formate lyase activating enzyme